MEQPPAFSLEAVRPRCRYVPFDTVRELHSGGNSSSPLKTSLCGEWAFSLFEGIESVPEEMLSLDFDLSSLPKKQVPAPLAAEENADSFPIPFCPGSLPPGNPAAVYLRDIKVQNSRPGMKRYLVFEGVSGGLSLFVNGQPAGRSCSTSLTEFEIGRFLKEGANRIAIVVQRFSLQTYFDRETMWNFFGIFRPVYILSRPTGHIGNLSIDTSLSEDFRMAEIVAEAQTDCPERVTIRVLEPDGAECAKARCDENGRAVLTLMAPRLWNTESPVMYTLEFSCCGEYIYKTVGLKKLSFDSDGLRLNGREIKLNGMIYEPSPCASPSELKKDVLKMKRANLNAVAICAGCSDDALLGLCDRYGLLAFHSVDINASAFEAAGSKAYASEVTFFPLIAERITKQTALLCNHTSLSGWLLDRFCAEGKNVSDATELLKTLDKRAVFSCGRPADGAKAGRFEQRPDGFCTGREFRRILSDPLCTKRPVVLWNVSAEDFEDGFAGSRRAVASDPRMIGSFVSCPDASLPELWATAFPFQIDEIDASTGDFYITNLFHFSYLSQLECTYEVTSRGQVTKTGFIGALPIPPGKCEKIHADYCLPEGDENYVRFVFRRLGGCVWAADGHEEGFVQFRLPDGQAIARPEEEDAPVKIDERDDAIVLSGVDFCYVFSKLTGYFREIMAGGEKLTTGEIRFSTAGQEAGIDRLCVAAVICECTSDSGTAVIRCEQSLIPPARSQGVRIVSVWCVCPDGKVTLDCSAAADEPFDLCKLGLYIPMKTEPRCFRYFGFGPHPNLPGRTAGCFTGVFQAERSRKTERRLVRSASFSGSGAKELCISCPDRMLLETGEDYGFAALANPPQGPQFEFSLALCPTEKQVLKFSDRI